MITLRKGHDRGYVDHGWLKSYHTFSFASYFDPDYQGFGPLLVINHDWVAPGAGFDTHGHRDMEILSYVLKGTMEHKDSTGHCYQLAAGEFQLMSAGTGIRHSEYNASASDELEFLQIWMQPDQEGLSPDHHTYQPQKKSGVQLIAAPKTEAAGLVIHQNARVYRGNLDVDKGAEHILETARGVWLHLIHGSLTVNDVLLHPGDAAACVDEAKLTLAAKAEAEFLLFDVPKPQ